MRLAGLFSVSVVLFFVMVSPANAYQDKSGCNPPNSNRRSAQGLRVRRGYLDFINPAVLKPFKDALPQVVNPEIMTALRSPDTMWYDEDSMVFLYQDSVESVVGGRANCVGRLVGETNPNPAIKKLMNYFGPDYRFMFPFRKAAGTDEVTNVRVLNFWSPPKARAKDREVTLPVKYWRTANRGHYYWTFPIGTLIGEVLYEQGPDQKWYVFEIRSRKRYRDGWQVNVFRPFPTADSLAKAIAIRQPDWQMSLSLRNLMQHLKDKNTLVAHRMESKAFAKVFPAINGALDPLPSIDEANLIIELLTQTPFVSCEGAIWKENGNLETYAPASEADFSIVPKGYEMGIIPVNEVSCARCHSEVSHRLGDFEFDIVLYGEVWGEDRIFTWHPFQPNHYIYQTYDEADSPTRTINPKMVEAGLLQNEQPTDSDPNYKSLPSAFKPDTKR